MSYPNLTGFSGVIGIIQIVFVVVVGLYFWNLLRSQQGTRVAVDRESKKELEKIQRLRRISLAEPLAERTRPQRFEEIVGQEEGLKALRAALCGPNPQHVLIYGSPGVGKTAAARLVLEEAKSNSLSPFGRNAKFVEMDATIARFDERGIADPLIGSVHDPIYQGAGAMGVAGIPQPKPGAVTKAHGGILFIDEIGELHPIQLNKLLKVLEDRKVVLESAYYNSEDTHIPAHIHDIFQNGLPADFRLNSRPQDIGYITNTQLILGKGVNNLQPGIISQGFKKCGKTLSNRNLFLQSLHFFLIISKNFTYFRFAIYVFIFFAHRTTSQLQIENKNSPGVTKKLAIVAWTVTALSSMIQHLGLSLTRIPNRIRNFFPGSSTLIEKAGNFPAQHCFRTLMSGVCTGFLNNLPQGIRLIYDRAGAEHIIGKWLPFLVRSKKWILEDIF